MRGHSEKLRIFDWLYSAGVLVSLLVHALFLYVIWRMPPPRNEEPVIVPVRITAPSSRSDSVVPSPDSPVFPSVFPEKPTLKPVLPPPPKPTKPRPSRTPVGTMAGAPAAKKGPVNPPKQGLPPSAAPSSNAIPVPVGNSLQSDVPGGNTDVNQPPSGPHTSPGGTGTGGQGVEGTGTGEKPYLTDEDDVRREPTHDIEACNAKLKANWSKSVEVAEGKAGKVVLSILVNEKGKVQSIKILSTFSKEIAAQTIGYLRFDPDCGFGPALDQQDHPVAYMISRYVIDYTLP